MSAATLCFAATILCFDSDALSAVVSLRPWHFFLLNYGTLVTRGRDRTFFSLVSTYHPNYGAHRATSAPPAANVAGF